MKDNNNFEEAEAKNWLWYMVAAVFFFLIFFLNPFGKSQSLASHVSGFAF